MSIRSFTNLQPLNFAQALRHPLTVNRAIKVAIVVGTILIAINQSDLLLQGQWPPFWKLGLTYMVPYSVSSYSSAMFIVDLTRNDPEIGEKANS